MEATSGSVDFSFLTICGRWLLFFPLPPSSSSFLWKKTAAVPNPFPRTVVVRLLTSPGHLRFFTSGIGSAQGPRAWWGCSLRHLHTVSRCGFRGAAMALGLRNSSCSTDGETGLQPGSLRGWARVEPTHLGACLSCGASVVKSVSSQEISTTFPIMYLYFIWFKKEIQSKWENWDAGINAVQGRSKKEKGKSK